MCANAIRQRVEEAALFALFPAKLQQMVSRSDQSPGRMRALYTSRYPFVSTNTGEARVQYSCNNIVLYHAVLCSTLALDARIWATQVEP